MQVNSASGTVIHTEDRAMRASFKRVATVTYPQILYHS